MKVVAHTGLVPVKALRRFRNNPAGAVFGVDPSLAVDALNAGDVELVEIPEGIEVIDLPDFGIPEQAPEVAVVLNEGLVEIPEDWRTAHGSKRAMIAKAILGLEPKAKLPVPDGQDVGQFAVSVIEAELVRRAVRAEVTQDQAHADPTPDETTPPPAPPAPVEPTPETPATTPAA